MQIPDSPAAVKLRDVTNISATGPHGSGRLRKQESVRRPARSIRRRRTSWTGYPIPVANRLGCQIVVHFHAPFPASAKREQVRLCARLNEKVELHSSFLCSDTMRRPDTSSAPFPDGTDSGKQTANTVVLRYGESAPANCAGRPSAAADRSDR